ncbi:ALDH-like protein [Aureobasidium namibiae CBS 147.97]|uniref:ALDH-like protein n=1 Tax=Aureobasidium namibiae CBS 147.97 TaxID=1043004 RepID=A0A074WHT3_9PEZI
MTASGQLDTALARVQSAAIDGRMRNTRTRQKQLSSLFKSLTEHANSFVDAMQKENNLSKEEANIVVSAMLLEVRQHYENIDFEKELAQEYSVRWGKSWVDRRVAARLVYIIPQDFTKGFSVFSALSAAIEAGSCCVVELLNLSDQSTALIRKIMNAALDKEAFVAISSTAPGSFLKHCLMIDQMHQPSSPQYMGKSLISKASGRVVAVVDRTAKIDSAVKEIFASRMQYGGQSHYAVDQVFINEFVADEFLAVMREEFSVRAEAIDQTVNNGHARPTPSKRQTKLVADDCTIVDSQGNAEAVMVKLRSSQLLHEKIEGPLLVIHKITSLDDAIDLILSRDEQVNALFTFADGPEAKYLSQFIPSAVTFVNHIPAELLIGSAGPVGYPVRPDLRYVREMFEEPSPQIVPEGKIHAASNVWKLRNSPRSAAILAHASRPLRPTGQAAAGAWGFFETGVLLGAAVYLLPVILGTIVGATYTGIWTYRKVIG